MQEGHVFLLLRHTGSAWTERGRGQSGGGEIHMPRYRKGGGRVGCISDVTRDKDIGRLSFHHLLNGQEHAYNWGKARAKKLTGKWLQGLKEEGRTCG